MSNVQVEQRPNEQMQEPAAKKLYTQPELTNLGDLETQTQCHNLVVPIGSQPVK